MSGERPAGGIFPLTVARGPIHIADPIPKVRVGVIYIRRKLVLLVEPIAPPAPRSDNEVRDHHHAVAAAIAGPTWAQALATFAELQGTLASNASGETGQILGIVIQYGDVPISKRVRAPNIGIPVEGVSLESGYPKTVGALPGASGAQLIGKFIHPPPPNQQLSPLTRF